VTCAGTLQINGLTKTYVRGEGVEIQFTNPQQGHGGVVLTNANNVVLSNFKISWLSGGARDPVVPGAQRIQSFGNVAACANDAVGGVLTLDLPLEGVQALGSVSVWSDTMGWPWYPEASNNYEIYFPTGATTKFSAGQSNCLPQLAGFVGQRVLLRHIVCSNHAFHCLGCNNVTVEQVRVISAPGMAFVFESGGFGISLIGDVVAPRCAPNCALPEPSTTADAAHFADLAGNILLENNDFGWQGDDGLNVTGLLVPANADLSASAGEPWLNVKAAWQGRLYDMAVGRKLALYDAGLSSLGEVEILAVAPSAGRIQVSSLPENVTNFIVARVDGIPKNVVVRKNQFHDNRARGILMGGSDALIEDNRIERVTMEAILVPADTGPWYEGPGAQHVTIESNTISNVNRYPAAAYPAAVSAGVSIAPGYLGVIGSPIQDIVVEGNSFTNVYTNANIPVGIGKGVSGMLIPGN
jgi:hypothetical protein